MQIKRSFIEWIAQQFGGRCACTIGQDAIVHLFIFGAITFFLRARHPALVIEWVIVFCLFVCSFRNSQEYLRQMLLVFFFFAFYAHLSHANSMSAYDRWQPLTRVIIATFSVSREHKRMQEKDHFFLALFGFYWHGTTTFWIWHDAQNEILSQSLFSIVACRNKQISAAKTHQIYSNL